MSLSCLKRLISLIALTVLTSCEYKELCYDHNHARDYSLMLRLNLKLDLDLELDVDEEAHTKIDKPDYMKVCFYDPVNGNLRNTEFVEGEGGPLHTPSGLYDMVVYSFGTEYVQIRGEGNVSTLEAFTSDITQTKAPALAGFTRSGEHDAPGPIIYTPDHLLVAHRQIEIPVYSATDTVITMTANAATIVETYGFEVTNIKGAEYIASAEAFVTNQARSSFFGRGEVNKEPATISFPVEVDRKKGTIHTTFNTFGKLPGESHSYLYILIIDSSGEEYHVSTDITDQFERDDHVIVIDEEIVIPQPASSGGGIAPTVNPWEEENHDVPIG